MILPVLHIKNTRQKGFSLIEVMIALVILLIGSLATLGGLNLSQLQQMRNMHTEEAKNIIRQLNSEVQTTSYNNIKSLDTSGTALRIIGTKHKTFSWTREIKGISTTGIDDNLGEVIITTVSWQTLADNNIESLTNTTIRGNYE